MYFELLGALPFVALLTSIALCPLLAPHWWEKHYEKVALGLGSSVAAFYLLILHKPGALVHTTEEYLSFIALIGALYIISGGIHIDVKGEATPFGNVVFLCLGAIVSNFLGTTGASMVLIRPWIRMNKYRITAYHIIFFIFIVSNVGGALTPIGDPPLFLGYLQGVPFFWILQHIWPLWLVALALILSVFYVIDARNFKKAPSQVRIKETGKGESWRFSGGLNVLLLILVISSVFISKPHFLREFIMMLCSVFSLWKTPRGIHEANDFSLKPIKEVALLFAGIFLTMIPALEWLEKYAATLHVRTPAQFFFSTGALSSFLDNAPTYLAFLSTAIGLYVPGLGSASAHAGTSEIAFLLEFHSQHVLAISAGAVFFGAMTYIGNGPNFLVKSIAEHSKIKIPTFMGYLFKYALPVLLPIFILVAILFFGKS